MTAGTWQALAERLGTVHRTLAATPEQIFAVLADGQKYHLWVVGAHNVRSVDSRWPEPGARLDHTFGFGLLHLNDETCVLDADPPHRLVLEAKGRPLGTTKVEIRLMAVGERTEVTMIETVKHPPAMQLMEPLFEPLIWLRNYESLRRLERLATAQAMP